MLVKGATYIYISTGFPLLKAYPRVLDKKMPEIQSDLMEIELTKVERQTNSGATIYIWNTILVAKCTERKRETNILLKIQCFK